MKETNGRFWIKIDGTNIKTALMEYACRVWNGGGNINDEEVKKLRKQYDNNLTGIDNISKSEYQDLHIYGYQTDQHVSK